MFTLGREALAPKVRRLLCLGAHPDDIEIGCGGTVLKLLDGGSPIDVTWVVFTSTPEREREAQESAAVFLARAATKTVEIDRFRDGFLPYSGGEVKDRFEALKRRVQPDLILAPGRHDAHQDHRLVAELAWNTFRNHLILEYEIPKYDGDPGAPNVFVHLDEPLVRRTIEAILTCFPSQTSRSWCTNDLFRGLLRVRGMEANAPDTYAEAFYCRKFVLF